MITSDLSVRPATPFNCTKEQIYEFKEINSGFTKESIPQEEIPDLLRAHGGMEIASPTPEQIAATHKAYTEN